MYEINVRNDHPALYFAADELKKYLRMMLPEGGDIPVGRGEGGFRVGLLDERSDDDTVFIETGETGGEILGSNPGAALTPSRRQRRLNVSSEMPDTPRSMALRWFGVMPMRSESASCV